MHAFLLALWISSAGHAALLEAWTYSSWINGTSMVGVDGWDTGYATDLWRGYHSSTTGYDYVQPTTDENGGDWGAGLPRDNWFTRGGYSHDDVVIGLPYYTYDDDCVGLVLHQQDAENFYLFFLTGGRDAYGGTSIGSNPVSSEGVYAAIAKIEGGMATVLASSEETYLVEAHVAFAASFDDGVLTFSYWDDADDLGGASPTIYLEAEDPDPLPAGITGMYAYDSGGPSGTETPTYFRTFHVWYVDGDDDGVGDDLDVCEEVYDPKQEDADADGLGDACDDCTDHDGDGYGFPGSGGTCAEDCDDTDPGAYPGAKEIPYDGIDQDCDGEDLVDVDGDGYFARERGGDDCDDNDASINPGAVDDTVDSVDQDCDGVDGNDAPTDDTGPADDTAPTDDTSPTDDSGDGHHGHGSNILPGGGTTCACAGVPARGSAAGLLLGLLLLVWRRRA